MSATLETQRSSREPTPVGTRRYVGQVVYVYAYDVAYEMSAKPVEFLLGQPVEPFMVGGRKPGPRHRTFYQPQMVALPVLQWVSPQGPVAVERSIKLLPVGAISITVRVPFAVDGIEDLVAYHDLHFDEGELGQEVRRLAEAACDELRPYCVRPAPSLVQEEAYTVFCLDAALCRFDGRSRSAEEWLQTHRRQIAALLTQETDVRRLSDQEALESTSRFLSYYQEDLVVVDWDAALIVDEKRNFEETLYIVELANLQLAELEAYDRLLDQALDRAYRDLNVRPSRKRVQLLRDLKEMRIDLTRMNDELSNITKFFGDWHLARIYEQIATRFHLVDWHRTIGEKLKALDDLYEILKHDQNNWWMLMLEVTIVLLFVIDLIMLFMGRG